MSALRELQDRADGTLDAVVVREAVIEAVTLVSGCPSVMMVRPHTSSGGAGLSDVHYRGVDAMDLERLAVASASMAAAAIEPCLSMSGAACQPHLARAEDRFFPSWSAGYPASDSARDRSILWVVRTHSLLGILRVATDPDRTEHALAAIDAISGWATAALERATSLEQHDEPLDLICDSAGSVLLSGEAGAPWRLEPTRRTRLERWVMRAAQGCDGPWLGIAGKTVSVRPLRALGDLPPAWLVRLTRAPTSHREGRHLLTPRQREVAERAMIGLHNSDIARELGLSEGTVKVHLRNAFRVLRVSTRAELGRRLRQRVADVTA